MNNEIVLLLEALLSLGIAIFFVYLSKYRYCENKRYASKYENNKKMLIFRLIVTEILKWGSIAMLICVVTKVLSVFIALYILTPLFIALHMIFFNTDYLKGVMTFTKGIYYVGLTIISVIQVFFATVNVAELALGFTLSLAIFESVSALYDGYKTIQEAKMNDNL